MKRKLRDVLGSMTFKEKVGYIWGYYKIHILVCLCLLLAISYTVNQVTGRKEVYLSVVFAEQYVSEEDLAILKEQLNDSLIPKGQQSDKEVSIQHIQFGNENDSTSVRGMQQLLTRFAARQIDILIMEEEVFQMLQEQDGFLPLNDLNGFYTLHLDEEDMVQDESSNNIYGIRMDNLEIIDNVAGSGERILSVIANSENQERVIEFLQFIVSL